MQIQWAEIKDSFRGFERLALLFVKTNFENPTWEKTSETRDGNKDGIAYVFGYQSTEGGKSQWWMEAKYSTERTIVTRYRLDATIVSAILQGNVKKVIFVTNIDIRAKTIIDIRKALSKATACHDVKFCTKPVLEDWLCNNIDIYNNFFPLISSNDLLERSRSLYLTQEIDFYPILSNAVAFVEPCKILYGNSRYVGIFSVYCPNNRTISLKKAPNCRGISILGKKKFVLHPGNNSIKFEIQTTSQFPSENTFYFLIDQLEVYPACVMNFSKNIHYNLPSQDIIVNQIRSSLKYFIRNNECEYCVISSSSGNGKTEILQKIASVPELSNEFIFYDSFSLSDTENCRLIVKLIYFLLFPYVLLDEIDEAFLYRVLPGSKGQNLLELVRLKDDYNTLIDYLIRKCNPKAFLPDEIQVNARIVFLDNLQFLSEPLFDFVKKLLVEIQSKKIPVYLVATIDKHFALKNCWKSFIEICNVDIYQLQLSATDVATTLKAPMQVEEVLWTLLKSGSFTAIELFSFAKYVSIDNKAFNTAEELLAALRLFQYSKAWERETRANMIALFSRLPSSRRVCDRIFYSYAPVYVDHVSEELLYLLESGFIKYDLNNCFIPRNEAIRDCYKKHFSHPTTNGELNEQSLEDRLRFALENEKSFTNLSKVVEEVVRLKEQKQYNAVIYICKSQFEDERYRTNLESRLSNSELFLKLYFAYAYAAQLQCSVETPRKHFQILFSRCQNSLRHEKMTICLHALWELANNDFEDLLYQSVFDRVEKANDLLNRMKENGMLSGEIEAESKYHDFLAIKCFVQSDLQDDSPKLNFDEILLQSKKFGFIDRYYNSKIRLALTQIITHPQKSLENLTGGIEYFLNCYSAEHKMYLFGMFSFLYYDMVLNARPKLFNKILEVHEKMQLQQYNNYRKRNFALATYCYWQNDTDAADRYLFCDMFVSRSLSKRTLGFYHETLALYHLKRNDYLHAISSLQSAAKIFSELDTYLKIPAHNISVLKRGSTDFSIQFWRGECLLQNVYYLDLRITW